MIFRAWRQTYSFEFYSKYTKTENNEGKWMVFKRINLTSSEENHALWDLLRGSILRKICPWCFFDWLDWMFQDGIGIPVGRPGAGAPMKDDDGNIKTKKTQTLTKNNYGRKCL